MFDKVNRRGSGNRSARKSARKRDQYDWIGRGLARCSDLAVQHPGIFYCFGRILKWRRRNKEHWVLRLGLFFLVAVLRENKRKNLLLKWSGEDLRFKRTFLCYERLIRFLTFLLLRFTFNLILGISTFRCVTDVTCASKGHSYCH